MFTAMHVPDQSGKTFFITGGNAGIGFESAKILAAKNARVLIGCRSNAKAEQARQEILDEVPCADIVIVSLDLGDLESIKSAAATVNREPRLNVLINNAGIMTPPLERTKQGFESQWGVNHLGPFVLTALLLDKLMATPASRVVNTSSIAHNVGVINFKDINAEHKYNTQSCYSQSKLANLLFSYELQQRLTDRGADVLSVACHPGIADTELSRHMPSWVRFTTPLVRLLFNNPAEGACQRLWRQLPQR